VPISLSTLTDQVGGCAALLRPLVEQIRAHVLAGARIYADDTPAPELAKGKTATGRALVYVRDDRPIRRSRPASGTLPVLAGPYERAR
jgi:transposase